MMALMRFAGLGFVLMALAACDAARSPEPTVRPQGDAAVWLASSRPAAPGSKEGLPNVVEVQGSVAEAKPFRERAPNGAWYDASAEVSRALVIRTDDGEDWTLAYRVQTADGVDVSPALTALVGTRVKLLFRAVRGFGTAPGFVLSDGRGLVFALDLAVYGDPLMPGDLPTVSVKRGRDLGVVSSKDSCFDSRHFALRFSGDTAIELEPGKLGTFRVGGEAHTAIALFDFAAEGEIRCTDTAGGATGWAMWR
jgi:hypothetical protein